MHHQRGDPTEKEAAPALARAATTLTSKSKGAFDKYDWIYTVFGDPMVSPVEAKVLAYPVLRYLRRGEDTFTVRLATVAERCAVSERQTRRAYTAAVDKGYLQVVAERRRGARGSGRQYRMTYPEVADTMSATQPDTMSASYRTPCPKVPDMANSPTSENDTPIRGLNRGLEEGTGDPPLNSADDEPRCADHADPQQFPIPPRCGRCKQVRDQRAEEQRMRTQREREELEARRQAIKACRRCDPNGWRLNPDGTDMDRPAHCHHTPTR